MVRPPLHIVCVEGSSVTLVTASASSGRVRASRAHTDRAGADDPRPLAERLGALGLSRGRAVLAVPRSAAVLKVLPIPEGLSDEGERLSMVSLQLERTLPTAGQASAIDSMVVETPDGPAAIAAATDGAPLERAREAVQACGARLIGAELRAAGAAALTQGDDGRPALVIAPGVMTTEIVLAQHGIPLFARAIDADAVAGSDDASDLDRHAARIAVEAKRTLMGARAAGLEEEPASILLLTTGDTGAAIADACELELGLPTREPSVGIEWASDIDAEMRARVGALVGIAARRDAGLDAIDFAAPHKPPDTGATRRQLALLALFALITVVGVAFIARGRHLSTLRARAEAVRAERDDAVLGYADFLAEDARVTHAELWAQADRDWLAHAAFVSGAVAETTGTKLGELRASSDTAFAFEPGPAIFPGTWTRQAETSLRVDGVAADAPSTRALRRRFLDAERFHVLTQGPDSGPHFTFDLVSLDRDVVEEPE